MTDGAIDNDFDDAKRPGSEILRERLAAFPRDVKPHDVVIDLVEGRPLFVSNVAADTAGEYFANEDFDLTTYKAHPWLPISEDDTIFECVFLPTKPADIPSSKGDKTYDYPRGRLARVPVEWLYDSDTRPQTNFRIATLAALFDTVRESDRPALFAVVSETFGGGTAHDAIERAGYDPHTYTGDDDG